MLKRTAIFILFYVSATIVFAQDKDSLTFVKTRWIKKNIGRQVKLFKYHFNQKELFGANENISFLDIKNNGRKAVFAIEAEKQDLITTENFGKRAGALAAVNGNFFDVKNGGSIDFVRVNGVVINSNRLEKSNIRAFHQRAAVVIEKGKIMLKNWDGSPDWEKNIAEQNLLLTGPLLVSKGKNQELDTVAFNRLRHPRTCVGVKANGHVILLTVDGRNANSAGMSLFELTKIMCWMGCIDVVNLDGGGSTTLWVNGYAGNGIINYPSDNKKWDHEGQRKVANVILVKKK